MDKITKYTVAFFMFLLVTGMLFIPVYAIYKGFVMVAGGSLWGILLVVVGFVIFRLFKPISNLYENKDFKIF